MANDGDHDDAVAGMRDTAIAVADLALTGGWLAVMQSAAKTANAARKSLGIITLAERTGPEALAHAVQDEVMEFVDGVTSGWVAFEERWATRQKHPKATDVAVVLEEGRKIYLSTSDDGKRRLLHNALVNAFDPDVYEAGMIRRLLHVLDELEYGDVVLLRSIYERLKTGSETDVATAKCWPGSDNHHHLTVLVSAGLVLTVGKRLENTETLQDNNKIRVSALGERLVMLLREPPSSPK